MRNTMIFKIEYLTFIGLTNIIESKLSKDNVSKVAIIEIRKFIEICKNQDKLDNLNALQNQGISHIIFEIQNDGIIDEKNGINFWDVENEEKQVYDFINKNGAGIVVVSS